MTRILRMQDAGGRGPWRPGFSGKWVDDNRRFDLPALQDDDFGIDIYRIRAKASALGLYHLGCAVRGDDRFKMWFTPHERVTLAMFGYMIVDASVCEILAESKFQVVIGSKQPLSRLPIANPPPA